MQLSDIFAEAYQVDVVELDRVICELTRIREERGRGTAPESAQAGGVSRALEGRPKTNGMK